MTRPRSVQPPSRLTLVAPALAAAVLLAAWATGPSSSAPAPRDPPPARPALTEAEARKVSANNLKQLALALVSYADDNRGTLPTAAVYDKKGKALLSWRVTILPQLDQGKLYKQFRLDESWDSTHNKALLKKMPKVFAPVRGKTRERYATYYQVFAGPETAFQGRIAARYPASFTDGTSNTFLVAEAGEAVPWTAPRDIDYDPTKPVPKLGGMFGGDFQAASADGATHSYKKGKLSETTLRNAINPQDGNVLGSDY